MSLAMIVYLIGTLDGMQFVIVFSFAISFLGSIALVFAMLMSSDYDDYVEDSSSYKTQKLIFDISRKSLKWCVFALVASMFAGVFVPTKETAYAMLAASGIETIVTDDRVQQLGGKSLDVIEQCLEEMSPEKEGE